MDIMRRTIGIVYNSEKMVDLVVKQLEKNGKVKSNETNENKRKIAAKVLVDSFIVNDMKYDKTDWMNTELEGLHMGKKKNTKGATNEIIYVKFKNYEDVKMIKNQLKMVTEEINDRVIPYVSHNSYERFQAIDNIAYQLRRRGNKPKMIFGKYDFLLLSKEKNDNTNWYNVPPRIIDEIPEFKVGEISNEDKKIEEVQRRERKVIQKEKNERLIEEEKNTDQNRHNGEQDLLKRINDINMSEMNNQEKIEIDEEEEEENDMEENEDENNVKRKNEEQINDDKKKTKSEL